MIKLRQSINEVVNRYDSELDKSRNKSDSFILSLLRAKNRWRCRNDLFFLCKVVGQDKIVAEDTRYFYEPFCDEVSLMNWQVAKLGLHKPSEDMLRVDEIADPKDLKYLQRLYLCFRTFWKTTIISKVHSLQLLLNFPDIHIVLCHNRQENASATLVAIKNMFLTSNLRTWFSECVPDSKEWGSKSKFSLANRTDWGRDEDNIMAVGVDTEITGGHWQIAKKNDLVYEKSVGTEEQLRKTISWDERFNLGNFDTPKIPLQDYEGTRYHFADMYSQLQTDPRIKFIKVSLLKDYEDNASCPLPERFNAEDIKILKEKDPWIFYTQMMLEPKDPAKMRFIPEMIVYYNSIPEGLNYYLLIDPASARKKKSDYTVMLVIGLDSEGKKYIIDGIRDKLDPKQRVDEAMSLATRWGVKGIGWETIGFQSTDVHYFEEKRRKEKFRVTVTEIKSHSVSKEDRIRGLIPDYVNHNWLWPPKEALVIPSKYTGKSYDLTEELEYEFLHFPLGSHDDLMDVQTFLTLMNTTTPQPIEKEKGEYKMTMGEYANLGEERVKELKLNPWGKLIPAYR